MINKTRKPVEDRFAKERALFQAMQKDKKDSDPTTEVIRKILEEHGLSRMPHPEKGKDYFTEEEIEEMKEEVLSRVVVPEAKVDYEALEAYLGSRVIEEFSKLPPPIPGKPGAPGAPGAPGKDAYIDIEALAKIVASKLPKAKKEKVLTLKDIKDYVDDIIKKIPRQPVRIGGSVASIRALTDVDISRVPTDSRGNYIFNRYNLTVDTVAPSSPQYKDLWVDMN